MGFSRKCVGFFRSTPRPSADPRKRGTNLRQGQPPQAGDKLRKSNPRKREQAPKWPKRPPPASGQQAPKSHPRKRATAPKSHPPQAGDKTKRVTFGKWRLRNHSVLQKR